MRVLRGQGVPDEQLPEFLQDKVVKKSRKGKVGQIVVRQLSGVQKNPAAQLARKLENEIAPSRDDLVEKLEASPTAGKQIKEVAALLLSRPDFSLARAIAECKADVAGVLDHYAKGALALKKMETVLQLYQEMPHLMRDIMRHAIDKEVDCEICLGVGKVPFKGGGKSLTSKCPRCGGTGRCWQSSEHKEFAVNKVLQLSEMAPGGRGPLVEVKQAVQVNQGGAGSDVLAKLSKAADEILYGTASQRQLSSGDDPYVVDAELSSEESKDA